MSEGVRQGIHFDMDTKALEIYYPKVSWRLAYDDVRTYLKKNGFEHEQGSGYRSAQPMTQAEAVSILDKMIDVFPWLHKCIRVCTVADVPITYDLSSMFDKSADIPTRDREKASVLEQIRAFKDKSKASEPSKAANRKRNEPER